jgi:hypothetical protein
MNMTPESHPTIEEILDYIKIKKNNIVAVLARNKGKQVLHILQKDQQGKIHTHTLIQCEHPNDKLGIVNIESGLFNKDGQKEECRSQASPRILVEYVKIPFLQEEEITKTLIYTSPIRIKTVLPDHVNSY